MLAVGLFAVFGAGGIGGVSAASAPVVFTAHIGGNLDNGNHGYWATLDYTRTVTITDTGAAAKEQDHHYQVKLTDNGTFHTLPGAANSPRAGKPVAAQVGTFTGSYLFDVVTKRPPAGPGRASYNYRCNPHGTGDRLKDCPGMPASTSDWPALYFGGTPGGNGQPATTPHDVAIKAGAYTWNYWTCVERWVDSSANDDGAAPSAGDITGRACPKPPPCPTGSPSPSASSTVKLPKVAGDDRETIRTPSPCPTPSSSSSPPVGTSTPSAPASPGGGGRLPTTGVAAGVLAVGGVVLLLIGGTSMVAARRRRAGR